MLWRYILHHSVLGLFWTTPKNLPSFLQAISRTRYTYRPSCLYILSCPYVRASRLCKLITRAGGVLQRCRHTGFRVSRNRLSAEGIAYNLTVAAISTNARYQKFWTPRLGIILNLPILLYVTHPPRHVIAVISRHQVKKI